MMSRTLQTLAVRQLVAPVMAEPRACCAKPTLSVFFDWMEARS